MYKVDKGAVHHKGEVFRKGKELPATFTNKEGYKHVSWCGKGDEPSKQSESDEIKALTAENSELKNTIAELEKAASKKSGK